MIWTRTDKWPVITWHNLGSGIPVSKCQPSTDVAAPVPPARQQIGLQLSLGTHA